MAVAAILNFQFFGHKSVVNEDIIVKFGTYRGYFMPVSHFLATFKMAAAAILNLYFA